MKLSRIFEPAVVLMPLVQKISLCARGIPVRAVAPATQDGLYLVPRVIE